MVQRVDKKEQRRAQHDSARNPSGLSFFIRNPSFVQIRRARPGEANRFFLSYQREREMARYEKNTPRKTEGVFAYPEYKKPVGRLSLGELRSATGGFETVFQSSEL